MLLAWLERLHGWGHRDSFMIHHRFANESRQAPLKGEQLRTEDEPARAEDPGDRRVELGAERGHVGVEVQERDGTAQR